MDATLQKSIQRLAQTRAEVAPLPAAPVMPALPATRAIGRDSAAAAGASSSIDSPLTEQSRTVYDTQSSDGLFVWSVPATITFNDAHGREVVLIFDQP